MKFFVSFEVGESPREVDLGMLLEVAAWAGEKLGVQGFFSYEVRKEGILFPHLPEWNKTLLVRWDGAREVLS